MFTLSNETLDRLSNAAAEALDRSEGRAGFKAQVDPEDLDDLLDSYGELLTAVHDLCDRL